MLDELPTLELSATAVALALALRVVVLLRREAEGLVSERSRVESARARDLIGLAILAGALVYALRVERASLWFMAAIGAAIVAQVLGFYLRASARRRSAGAALTPDPASDEDSVEEEPGCPVCGHASMIEITEPSRLLGGLNKLTPVSAAVCPHCGTLTGQVQDVSKVSIGPEHGTALRKRAADEEEPLEEPAEHDG